MNCQDSRPTVLVVEDHASLRRLVVRMLASGGFSAIAVGTAAEGLAQVRERQGAFALAILDIVMPGISGLDLATDLYREYPDLKILYISGYVHSLAADVLSRRSPEIVLLKPFSREALVERVHLLLEQPQRREAARASQPSAPEIHDGTVG